MALGLWGLGHLLCAFVSRLWVGARGPRMAGATTYMHVLAVSNTKVLALWVRLKLSFLGSKGRGVARPVGKARRKSKKAQRNI